MPSSVPFYDKTFTRSNYSWVPHQGKSGIRFFPSVYFESPQPHPLILKNQRGKLFYLIHGLGLRDGILGMMATLTLFTIGSMALSLQCTTKLPLADILLSWGYWILGTQHPLASRISSQCILWPSKLCYAKPSWLCPYLLVYPLYCIVIEFQPAMQASF